MFVHGTYFSVGVSPDAESFVMQTFVPDTSPWPCVVYTGSLSELLKRGRAEANRIIGCLALRFMTVHFPVVNLLSESLIPAITFEPLVFDPSRDRSGAKRPLHLRIHAETHERILTFRRFSTDEFMSRDIQTSLSSLIDLGPEAAADRVGSTILAELSAVHPDVFSAYPARS